MLVFQGKGQGPRAGAGRSKPPPRAGAGNPEFDPSSLRRAAGATRAAARPRVLRTWRLAIGGMVSLALAGCRQEAENAPIPAEQEALRELAAVYRDFQAQYHRGPKSLAELERKGQAYPNAMRLLKSGELVVQWGARLTPQSSSSSPVLAYFKTAPEEGGHVLLQDGETIKHLSAQEFQAAPRAGAS